jgi:hypothetical protein
MEKSCSDHCHGMCVRAPGKLSDGSPAARDPGAVQYAFATGEEGVFCHETSGSVIPLRSIPEVERGKFQQAADRLGLTLILRGGDGCDAVKA